MFSTTLVVTLLPLVGLTIMIITWRILKPLLIKVRDFTCTVITDFCKRMMLFKKFKFSKIFIETPKKTSHTYAFLYAINPAFMLSVSFLISYIDFHYDVSEIINILPLLLMQFPAYQHAFEMSRRDRKIEKNPVKYKNYKDLNIKLIEKEKAALNYNAILSTTAAYAFIFGFKILLIELNNPVNDYSINQNYNDEKFFFIIYFIFVLITSFITFLYLRLDIFCNFIKENKMEVEIMNHFLKVFNNEMKYMKNDVIKESKAYNEQTLLEAVENDIGRIPEHFGPVIEAIRENYDNSAEIKHTKVYKAGDEMAVVLKEETVLSYELDSEKVSAGTPAVYRIKTGRALQLPDMLVQISDNGQYYYFEDKISAVSDSEKDDLVGIPYQDEDGSVENTQFERILEKHVARLARFIL